MFKDAKHENYLISSVRIVAILFLSSNNIYSQSWTNTGPYGAIITELTIDPTDTNIIYAGTYGAGIYKSIDGGEQWKEANEGLPIRDNNSIGSPTQSSWWFGDYFPIIEFELNAQESARIFAGTNGGGISKSVDAAKVWVESNQGLPDAAKVRVIWQHPEDTSIIYIGASWLYVSADGGLQWNLVDGVPSGATYEVTTITAQPNDPNIMYVGVTSAGEPEFAWGLLKTSDGGESWEVISQNTFAFYDLQIDPSDPSKIWSAIYTGFFEWHLAYSEDGGFTWSVHPDFSSLSSLGLFADSKWNLSVLAIRGNNVKEIGTSEDAGETWNITTVSLPTLGSIAKNPHSPKTLYVGTIEGVYRSNDGGVTFALKSDGMINSYMNEIKVNPINSSIIYAGGEQGFWRSMDDGSNWKKIHDVQVNSILIDPSHPDTVYWGGEMGLYRSFDGGENAELIRESIITSLAIHPDSANVLYAGVFSSRLYKSEDYGETWSLSFSSSNSFWVEDIEISRSNSHIIYFGAIRNAVHHGLYKSTNSGASWVMISDPGEVFSISTHPSDKDIIYFASRFGVFRSFDGGISYSEISGDLTVQQYSTILVNPQEPSQIIIGTKDQGVFVSNDTGSTWNRMEGPYNLRILDISYSGDLNRIFLATHGGGIWEGNDIEVGVSYTEQSHVPETFQLFNNYPNPFNPVTSIGFTLPKAGLVRLIIYDLQGREVARLVDGEMSAGFHNVTWDASRMASGVYIYRLTSGNFVATKKMVLLK